MLKRRYTVYSINQLKLDLPLYLINNYSSQDVKRSGYKHDWQHISEIHRTPVANILIAILIPIINRHDLEPLQERNLSLLPITVKFFRIFVGAIGECDVGVGLCLIEHTVKLSIFIGLGLEDGVRLLPATTL